MVDRHKELRHMQKRDTGATLSAEALPREVAFQLCEEIREENRGRWYRWKTWMCWGCTTFSRGDPARMCVGSQPDYRGCVQVNTRYDAREEAER
jgi:hypothetical protein